MKTFFILLLYNILLPLALLISLPGYLIKMRRRGGYGGKFMQRFAVYGGELVKELRSGPKPFWIHAVSVGEVGIAKNLIREIRERDPERRLVLTTTTSTGYAIAEKMAQKDANLIVLYNPLDLPPVTWRARRVIRPERIILVEAEIWPNLVRGAQKRGIPTALVNARLSPRSERRYLKFGWAVRPIFGLLDTVCVQEPEDRERWSALGIATEKIVCTGSIKFDQAGVEEPVKMVAKFRGLLASIGVEEGRPVVLAASTHPGEEAQIGKACLKLRGEVPDVFFVAVPRHFERSGDAVADLREIGFSPLLRSELDTGENGSVSRDDSGDCLVVDTTGELRAWQFLADVVVIGKSFLHKGGQNPAEAIAAGHPVVFGPHMENFSALANQLLKKGGALQVTSELESLEKAVGSLLKNPQQSSEVAAAGRSVLDAHLGATARTVDLLLVEKVRKN